MKAVAPRGRKLHRRLPPPPPVHVVRRGLIRLTKCGANLSVLKLQRLTGGMHSWSPQGQCEDLSLLCVYVMQLCILNAVSFNRFLHILLRRKRHTDTDRDAVQVQRCTQTYIRTSPSKGRTAEERAWRNARNRAKAKAGTLPACSAGFLIQVRLDLSMIQFQWLYICHTHAPACFILAAAFQAAKFRRPACRTPPAA